MANTSAAGYAAAYKELNNEQLQAVNQLDGPLLVIAGPGTGKTQLLAVRVGRILKQTDAGAENILCLTFSESAARAMKQRLASLIGPAARDVTVSTYHGFGRALITNYPERFSAETLAAKPADELLLDKLLRQVQSELPYANPLKNDYYLNDLKALISSYKRALITPDQLEQVLSNNQAFMDAASTLLIKLLPPDFRLSKTSLALFEQLLDASADLPGEASQTAVPFKQLWLEQLSAALEEASELKHSTPLRRWKDRWLIKNGSGQLIVASPSLLHKQQAFVAVFRRYNALLEELGLFDYDDMIMLAIKGLADNPDLRQTLQERYLYIQLDEFQDTNEAQLKLVELLANHPVNEGRPNILAVGDDDQAIYSFQGAHYSHMERFLKSYNRVSLVTLKQNYRSSSGIISLSEQVRSQISDALTITKKQQVSATPNGTKEVVERVELPKDVEQLAWVSNYLSSLIQSGVKASDIALFAPKHQLLSELIPYLHASGVAINYEQKNNVLADQKINQLLAAARLTIALNDSHLADTLWPQVLSHDYWQLPTSLIWQLSLQAAKDKRPWTDLLLAEKRTANIALFFIRLSQIANDASFELMLSYLMGNMELQLNERTLSSVTSPFYSYYFSGLSDQNDKLGANSWRLLGQLSILSAKAKASSEQRLNLAEFVDFCDSYTQAKLSIIDSSPFREAEEAVNLMTAYSAKGQEFDTVILLDVVDSVWGHSARRQSSKIALPANLAHVRLDKNSDDEKLRLLFVALSRAKRRLILTSYTESLNGRPSEPLGYLGEYSKDSALISPYLPKNSQSVKRPKLAKLELDLTQPTWWSQHLDYLSLDVDKHAVLSDRLANFHLSATNLNAYTNVIDGGPRLFFVDQILRFPKAQPPRAEYGSAIHITLDWSFKQTRAKNGKPPKLDLLLSQFETQLLQRRLGKVEQQQLLQRGKDALSAYYEQVPQIVGPDDQSEYSFSPSLGENNIRLSGTIDRILIDRKNNTLQILDFKSGASYDRFSRANLKSLHHQRQLYFYKLLLEQTPKFKAFNITSAKIQFVEPDDEGRIASIELKFDQAEADKLLELIKVVWGKIMSLQFPSTEHYAKSINGIYAFEHDLLTHAHDK